MKTLKIITGSIIVIAFMALPCAAIHHAANDESYITAYLWGLKYLGFVAIFGLGIFIGVRLIFKQID